MVYRIGEVAKQLGVSPSLLRKLEGERLLPEPRRTRTGFRVYDERQLPVIESIVAGRMVKPPAR